MCCFFASLGLCYFLYIVRKAKLVKSMFSPSLLSWPRLWSLHGRKLKMCAELLTAGQNTSESREVLTLVRRSRLQLSAANSLYKTVPRPCFMQPLEFILGSRKLCSPHFKHLVFGPFEGCEVTHFSSHASGSCPIFLCISSLSPVFLQMQLWFWALLHSRF